MNAKEVALAQKFMKIRHKTTGKVYTCYKIHNGIVGVRTNAEVYPDANYDFSKGDGCGTMYYVPEPIVDFEILEDRE